MMDLFKKRQFFQLINDDDQDQGSDCFIELAAYSNVNNENIDNLNNLNNSNEKRLISERNLVLYTSDYRLHLFQYGSFVDLPNINQNNEKKWRHWIIPINSKNGKIISMCFDQQGEQLLAITDKSILYIVPFYFVIINDSVNENRTIIEKDAKLKKIFMNKIQQPTCIVWWQRNQRYHVKNTSIAIIGTKLGEIFMIDLDQDYIMCNTTISTRITSLKLYDEMYNKSLLIQCEQDEQQYQLILEEYRYSSTTAPSTITTTNNQPFSIIDQHQQSKSSIDIKCLPPKKSSTFSKLSEFFQLKSSKESKESKTTVKTTTTPTTTPATLTPTPTIRQSTTTDFQNYYLSCLLDLPFENDNDVVGQIRSKDLINTDNDDDFMHQLLQPQLIKFNYNNNDQDQDQDIFSFNSDDLLVPLINPTSSTISTNQSKNYYNNQQEIIKQSQNVKIAIFPPNLNNLNNNIYVVKYQNCAKLKLSSTSSSSSDASSTKESDDFLIINTQNNDKNGTLSNKSSIIDNFCNISLKNEELLFEFYEYSVEKFCTKTILLSSARLFQITIDCDIDNNIDGDERLIKLIDCSNRFLMLVFPTRLLLISKIFSEQTNNRSITNRIQTNDQSPRSPLLLKRSDSSGHHHQQRRSSPLNRSFGGSFRRKSPNSSPKLSSKSTSMSNLSSCNSIIAEFKFSDGNIVNVFNVNESMNNVNIREYIYRKLSTNAIATTESNFDQQERNLIEILSSTDLDESTLQLDEEFFVVTKSSVEIIETKEKSFGRLFHQEILKFIENNFQDGGDLINRAKYLIDCFTGVSGGGHNLSSHNVNSHNNETTTLSSSTLMIPSQSWQLWLCRSALLLMKQLFYDQDLLPNDNDDDERIKLLSLPNDNAQIDSNQKQSSIIVDQRMNQIFRLLELSRCPRRRVITALNVNKFWSRSIWQIEKFFHTKILFELMDDERNYLAIQMFYSLLSIYQFYLNNNSDKIIDAKNNLYKFLYNYRHYYQYKLILLKLINLQLYDICEYLALLHGDYLHFIYFLLNNCCNGHNDDNKILNFLTSKYVTYSLILSTEFINCNNIYECRSIKLIEQYLQFIIEKLPTISLPLLKRLIKNVFNIKNLSTRLLLNQTLNYCNQTYLCNQDDDDQFTDNDTESETSLIITSTGNLRKSLLPIKCKDLLNLQIFLQSLYLKKLIKNNFNNYNWSFIEKIFTKFIPKHLENYERKLFQKQRNHQQNDYHLAAGTYCSLLFNENCYYQWGRFNYTYTNSERLEQVFLSNDKLQPEYTNHLSKPQCMKFFSTIIQDSIRSISMGYQHMMILTDNGIYGIGSSTFGQLGLGTQILSTRYPLLLSFGQNNKDKISKIVCGSYHTLLLSTNGHIYSFGWSLHGQLGHHNQIDDQFEPKLIRYFIDTIDVSIVDVAAGYAHTAALTNTGDLYLFGQNFYGQLGTIDRNKQKFSIPQKFTLIPGPIRMICCGLFHTVIVVTEKTRDLVYCWGIDPKTWRLKMRADRSNYHQNFNNNINQSNDYTKIREINLGQLQRGSSIKKIVSGQSHTLLLTDQGNIYSFGNGRDGQLGLSKQHQHQNQSMIEELEAQPIDINDDDDDDYKNPCFTDIACGSFHSLAIDSDGNVWGWGQNSCGQLYEQHCDNVDDSDQDLPITASSHDVKSINLNSSSMVNHQMFGSPNTTTTTATTKQPRQPSILFSISSITERQQNFKKFQNFIGYCSAETNQKPKRKRKQNRNQKINKFKKKILLTILYNHHELNLKSMKRRFEQLELYDLCSFLEFLNSTSSTNNLIESSKYLFLLLKKNSTKSITEDVINLMTFYLKRVDLVDLNKSMVKCRLTAKLLEIFIKFYQDDQDGQDLTSINEFSEIIEKIYLSDESMINPYFGPQFLLLIKNFDNIDTRRKFGLTDQFLMKIVRKSIDLIQKCKILNQDDPIVTIQQLFTSPDTSFINNRLPLEIRWQNIVDQYFSTGDQDDHDVIDIDLNSDIEQQQDDPLILIFKCGHGMTGQEFLKKISTSTTPSNESYIKIKNGLLKHQSDQNDEILAQINNDLIKNLNCFDCCF